MKVRLSYGIMDIEDVVAECEGYLKFANVTYEVTEDEHGNVSVLFASKWRFEIKKCVERFLGEFKGLADSVIDENIVQ